MNFKAILALLKTAHSAQTHTSISFIWIVWSTLYVYLWCQAAMELIYFFQICGYHLSETSKLWVPGGHGTHTNSCPEEHRQTRRRRLRATTSLYCILCYVKIVAKPPLMHSKMLLKIVLFNNSFLHRFSLKLLLNSFRKSKHKICKYILTRA